MRESELTPGVSAREYSARRQRLMSMLPDESVVIVAAKEESWMAHDIPFLYRQDPDFFYLTGLLEPDSLLILQGKGADMTLLVRPRDKSREIWDGPRAGLEGASQLFGAHTVGDFRKDAASTLSEAIAYAAAKGAKVFVDLSKMPRKLQLDEATREYLNRLRLPKRLGNPHDYIERMRVVKSPAEIQLMRNAAEVTGASFVDAIGSTLHLHSETELSALMEYGFKKRGAEKLAYPYDHMILDTLHLCCENIMHLVYVHTYLCSLLIQSVLVPFVTELISLGSHHSSVVAGGKNACTLHYIANNQLLPDDGLVLVDAGCELHGYASDVTRTWPTRGRFNTAQKALYEAVLDCQLQCIEASRADQGVSQAQIHALSVKILTDHLLELGLLRPQSLDYHRFYPHAIGHQLGIDTHDVPTVNMSQQLQAGMVITIEPGLYVPMDAPDWVPDEFRGIGIRIEDDIVIAAEGAPEVLTERVPKTVNELESLILSGGSS